MQFKLSAKGIGGVWTATLHCPDGTIITFNPRNEKDAIKTARTLAEDWKRDNAPHATREISDTFSL